MLRKFAIGLLVVIGLLIGRAVKSHGQDAEKKDAQPGTQADVAHVTTFSVVVVNIKLSEQEFEAIRLDAKGNVVYRHITDITNDMDFHKKTIVAVSGKFDDDDLDVDALKDAFAALRLDTLHKGPKDEPRSWVTIQALSGEDHAAYKAKLGDYGDDKDRVTFFLDAVKKITDRLR